MPKPEPWIMPKWMNPYAEHIVNTGGNSIESMVNGHASPEINLPLSTLQACVKSQVGLLYNLQEKGLLRKKPAPGKDHIHSLVREDHVEDGNTYRYRCTDPACGKRLKLMSGVLVKG